MEHTLKDHIAQLEARILELSDHKGGSGILFSAALVDAL
jgi:hypothetical protein